MQISNSMPRGQLYTSKFKHSTYEYIMIKGSLSLFWEGGGWGLITVITKLLRKSLSISKHTKPCIVTNILRLFYQTSIQYNTVYNVKIQDHIHI